MCISPTNLKYGVQVPCRNCWQCHKNKVNDYVGRCIAEQQISKQVLAVTLTYAGDETNTATLVYDDIQRFMKRLKKVYKTKDGNEVRFIVAGEYGSRNGRPHWHICLFFKGDSPEVVQFPDDLDAQENMKVIFPRPWFEERGKTDLWAQIQWHPWSSYDNNGFVYFQPTDYHGFQYIMKYQLKDTTQKLSVSHFGSSKQPPLGHDYFMALAQWYVDNGLSPQSFFYSFPSVFDGKGKRRKFYIQGKSRDNFVWAFIEKWQQQRGTDHPHSELIIDHVN